MHKDIVFEVEKDEYTIQLIFDVSVEEQLDYFKSNEEPPIRYRIKVKRNKQLIAEYVRDFEAEPTPTHLNNFFKKILGNKEYRKQYLAKGDWDEEIKWDELINPRTKEDIKYLNATAMNTLKFKDFKNLRVDGVDGYSRMKTGELDKLLSKVDQELIKTDFEDKRLQLAAKRWVARGLQVNKAIRKVKTDEEIRNNIKK